MQLKQKEKTTQYALRIPVSLRERLNYVHRRMDSRELDFAAMLREALESFVAQLEHALDTQGDSEGVETVHIGSIQDLHTLTVDRERNEHNTDSEES
jgi:predicted DNA-binding protein